MKKLNRKLMKALPVIIHISDETKNIKTIIFDKVTNNQDSPFGEESIQVAFASEPFNKVNFGEWNTSSKIPIEKFLKMGVIDPIQMDSLNWIDEDLKILNKSKIVAVTLKTKKGIKTIKVGKSLSSPIVCQDTDLVTEDEFKIFKSLVLFKDYKEIEPLIDAKPFETQFKIMRVFKYISGLIRNPDATDNELSSNVFVLDKGTLARTYIDFNPEIRETMRRVVEHYDYQFKENYIDYRSQGINASNDLLESVASGLKMFETARAVLTCLQKTVGLDKITKLIETKKIELQEKVKEEENL